MVEREALDRAMIVVKIGAGKLVGRERLEELGRTGSAVYCLSCEASNGTSAMEGMQLPCRLIGEETIKDVRREVP